MKQRKQHKQVSEDFAATTDLPAVYKGVLCAAGAIRPHLPVVGAVGGGLLLVVVVAVSVVAARGSKIARGYAQLGEATTADELLDIAVQYEKLPPGEAAAFRAAQQLLVEGRCDQASTRFSLFCREYPRSRDLVRARLGEAYGLEGDEKLVQAGKAFVAVARELANDPELIAEAYMGAARCAQSQGMLAEARKWLDAAVSSGSEGHFRDTALGELKELAVVESRGGEPVDAALAGDEAAAPENVEGGKGTPAEEEAKPKEDVGASGDSETKAPEAGAASEGADKAAAKAPTPAGSQ